MWSPKGQQVTIPTPGQPDKYYGIGAVNYRTGESVVQFQRRKRRKEIAQLLEALLEQHPIGTVYVAWDNASMHEDNADRSGRTGSRRPARLTLLANLQPLAQSD
jgi:putative transposase